MASRVTEISNADTVFLDLASLDQGDLNLAQLKQVAAPLQLFAQTRPDELKDRTDTSWCVITNKVVLDRAFFKARPHLRLVCITATGTNNVDLQAAADNDVAVVNCRGYSTATVAQHALMLTLALARSLPQYQAEVTYGNWSASSQFCLLNHPVRELGDLRMGILGYGAIGQEVGRLAQAFGMQVVVSERPGQTPRDGRVAFEEVLRTCDVISLHCPLTDATAKMIDINALRAMRPSAILINTARGQLINEPDLVHALRGGEIAGAAVDVVSTEPPPLNNPLVQAKLPNLIITPHCAWGSRQARQAAIDQTADNIAAWLAGEAVRRVV